MHAPDGSNALNKFSSGFYYPFRGGRFLLAHPRLLRFVLFPFLVNIAVFSVAVYLGLGFFNQTVTTYLPQAEAWYWLLLYYVLWLAAVVLTAVLVFFGFSVAGNLIAAPFNDLLSERVEEVLTGGRREESFSLAVFFRDTRRTLGVETRKMGLFVLGMLLLLLLNLVPVLGTFLYALLSVLLTLFFLAVEYTGFVFSRHRLDFRLQRRYIFARKALLLGFSSGVLALLAIPFLQLLCIPAAVAGATLLCNDFPPEPLSGDCAR